jgi:hypothetical protein
MWPSFFPPSCPPPAAQPDSIEAFRLVSNDPPLPSDFLPTVQEAPHRSFGPDQVCIACGVSVFRTAADAERTRARFKPLRHKRVARGTIEPEDGLLLQTGQPTHTTWWLATATPHVKFTEVLP